MEKKEDIFDRIMKLPVLRLFEPLYKKYKSVLLYLFFGVLTTIVSIGSFALFYKKLGINELAANVLSWIFAVTFAFITNRIWVFNAQTEGAEAFIRQAVSFYTSRLVTLGIEEVILLIFVTWLHGSAILFKILAQFVVLVLNYVLSKLVVFRKK